MNTTRELVFLNEKIAKKLFKNEKYGKILSAKVISDVIGADYEEVYNNIKLSTEEIAFSSLTVNSTADALYYNNATYFNIELNFNKIDSKEKQLESYVYQLYLGQLHSCHDYNKIKRIMQISIDTYDWFNKNEFMYDVILMEKKYHIPYNDLIRMVHINLDYLRKIDYNQVVNGKNKLMKDLYFLTNNDNELISSLYERDSLMKKIVDEAKQIAGIEKMNLYLTDEEMLKLDQEHYIEVGKNENQKMVIMNMLNKNYSLDTIADIVNLTIEEVKKIIKHEEKN